MKYKITPSKLLGIVILCAVIWWQAPWRPLINLTKPNPDPFGRSSWARTKLNVELIDRDTRERASGSSASFTSLSDNDFKESKDLVNGALTRQLAPGIYRVQFYSGAKYYPESGVHSMIIDTRGASSTAEMNIEVLMEESWEPSSELSTMEDSSSLRIQCVDESGSPVAQAAVNYLEAPMSPVFSRLMSPGTTSDASGALTVSLTTSRSSNAFYLSAGSLCSRVIETNFFNGTNDKPSKIQMFPAAGLQGRVTEPDGSPAAGLIVIATFRKKFASDATWYTRTDDDGRYKMPGLPEGEYNILIHSGHFTEFVAKGQLSSEEWDSFHGSSAAFDTSISTSLFVLKMLKNAVKLKLRGGHVVERQLDVEPGKVKLGRPALSDWHTVKAIASSTLKRGELVTLDLQSNQLRESEALYTGVLRGEIYGQPTPEQYGLVEVLEQDSNRRLASYYVQSSGEFYVDGLPRGVALRVEARADSVGRYSAKMEDVFADAPYLKLELHPDPVVGVEIVEAGTGQPVKDIYLSTSSVRRDGKWVREFQTADGATVRDTPLFTRYVSNDGRFTLDDVTGDNWVIARGPGYSQAYGKVSSIPNEDGYLPTVKLQMPPGLQIKGKVLNTRGEPLRGACAVVDFEVDINTGRDFNALVPQSAADGSFTIDYAEPDSTHFVVWCKGYEPAFFELPKPGGEITCTLADGLSFNSSIATDGTLNRRSFVTLEYIEECPLRGAKWSKASDAAGNGTISGLRPGRYRLKAEIPYNYYELPVYEQEVSVIEGGVNRIRLDFNSSTNSWTVL